MPDAQARGVLADLRVPIPALEARRLAATRNGEHGDDGALWERRRQGSLELLRHCMEELTILKRESFTCVPISTISPHPSWPWRVVRVHGARSGTKDTHQGELFVEVWLAFCRLYYRVVAVAYCPEFGQRARSDLFGNLPPAARTLTRNPLGGAPGTGTSSLTWTT